MVCMEERIMRVYGTVSSLMFLLFVVVVGVGGGVCMEMGLRSGELMVAGFRKGVCLSLQVENNGELTANLWSIRKKGKDYVTHYCSSVCLLLMRRVWRIERGVEKLFLPFVCLIVPVNQRIF